MKIMRVVPVQSNSKPVIYALVVNLELPFSALVSPSVLSTIEPWILTITETPHKFVSLINNKHGRWAKYQSQDGNLNCRVMINGMNKLYGNQIVFYSTDKGRMDLLHQKINPHTEVVVSSTIALASDSKVEAPLL